ncbi:MAG TPA: hypothetical protein VGI58_03160 [Streptosporangiaceae bacterium]
MTTEPDVVSRCAQILGPIEVTGDLAWPGNGNQVLEICDSDGRLWIAKALADDSGYQRERDALQRWAPALGDAAPALRGADDRLRLLIMTRLPGQRAEGVPAETDPAAHRQAGRLTRLLHDAEPARVDDGILAATAIGLERSIEAGGHLLTGDEIAFARSQVQPMAELGPVPTVPTHMDNQPRNWVVDNAGVIRLIDFGRCRRDVWIRDMQRLYFQQWEHRPDLRDAFYAGYGREPDATDASLLRGYLAYQGLSTVVWATRHGDPAFAAHGHRILAELLAGNWPVA